MKNQEMVTLKTSLEKSKSKDRKFSIQHANNVLSLTNSKWELNDKNYKWNGTELAKAAKA